MDTLTRPDHTALHVADERAIGSDGLTDVERENAAWRYRTSGAGRPMGRREAEDVARWLRERRAARMA